MDKSKLPRHIAFIMDGNGRWAKKRGLPRSEGHRAGIKTVERVIDAAKELNIEFISLFAFSTENWNRPKDEVALLLRYLNNYLKKEMPNLRKKNVKLLVSGKIEDFNSELQNNLRKVIEETKYNQGLAVNLCLNYGGRADILHAVRGILEDIGNNKIKIGDINEEIFSSYLYTGDIPNPDLLIRTSGEKRISNFFLWQLSYAELYFTDVLWPDFNKEDLIMAIEDYHRRLRRFGRL